MGQGSAKFAVNLALRVHLWFVVGALQGHIESQNWKKKYQCCWEWGLTRFTFLSFLHFLPDNIVCQLNVVHLCTMLCYYCSTEEPVLASAPVYTWEDFVRTKIYCICALADRNLWVWIREKMFQFSSPVVPCLWHASLLSRKLQTFLPWYHLSSFQCETYQCENCGAG